MMFGIYGGIEVFWVQLTIWFIFIIACFWLGVVSIFQIDEVVLAGDLQIIEDAKLQKSEYSTLCV